MFKEYPHVNNNAYLLNLEIMRKFPKKNKIVISKQLGKHQKHKYLKCIKTNLTV